MGMSYERADEFHDGNGFRVWVRKIELLISGLFLYQGLLECPCTVSQSMWSKCLVFNILNRCEWKGRVPIQALSDLFEDPLFDGSGVSLLERRTRSFFMRVLLLLDLEDEPLFPPLGNDWEKTSAASKELKVAKSRRLIFLIRAQVIHQSDETLKVAFQVSVAVRSVNRESFLVTRLGDIRGENADMSNEKSCEKHDRLLVEGHMYRTKWGIGHGLKGLFEAHKAHHMYSMPPYPYLATDYGTQLSLFTHHMWIGRFLIVGAAAHAAIFMVRDYDPTQYNDLLDRVRRHRDAIISYLNWTSWQGNCESWVQDPLHVRPIAHAIWDPHFGQPAVEAFTRWGALGLLNIAYFGVY
ncbi:hypothetical protein ACH5RR_039354 [Cinchona calisaya]|uniref:Uncharacterized protein n=1 Tax=Cinchona calisaya TaxID=153742 RepID=A0ABD2Y0J3_9GENT